MKYNKIRCNDLMNLLDAIMKYEGVTYCDTKPLERITSVYELLMKILKNIDSLYYPEEVNSINNLLSIFKSKVNQCYSIQSCSSEIGDKCLLTNDFINYYNSSIISNPDLYNEDYILSFTLEYCTDDKLLISSVISHLVNDILGIDIYFDNVRYIEVYKGINSNTYAVVMITQFESIMFTLNL